MSDVVMQHDELEALIRSVGSRCDTCAQHAAHEARITRLETVADTTCAEISALKVEVAKTRTTIMAVVLISSPIWTAVVAAIVYSLAH